MSEHLLHLPKLGKKAKLCKRSLHNCLDTTLKGPQP